MAEQPVMMITGSRRGIGKALTDHYLEAGFRVVGCSRNESEYRHAGYRHFRLDVADEPEVKRMFSEVRKSLGRLDVLINNAAVASMNHILLTPLRTVGEIFETNVLGTFLFSREAARLMQEQRSGRIVNLATVATPLKLEGEAAYAASKAAVVSLTEIMARELAGFGITVSAVGPGPVETDLTRAVPQRKMEALLARQAIPRFGEMRDIWNVIDFFIRPESDFVTGQVLFLGGV